jgi:hypothetical protein
MLRDEMAMFSKYAIESEQGEVALGDECLSMNKVLLLLDGDDPDLDQIEGCMLDMIHTKDAKFDAASHNNFIVICQRILKRRRNAQDVVQRLNGLNNA